MTSPMTASSPLAESGIAFSGTGKCQVILADSPSSVIKHKIFFYSSQSQILNCAITSQAHEHGLGYFYWISLRLNFNHFRHAVSKFDVVY
jgi:hypothetical protein